MIQPIQFAAPRQDCRDSARRFYGWDATHPSAPPFFRSAPAALAGPARRVRGPVHPSDVVARPIAARRRHPGTWSAYRHGCIAAAAGRLLSLLVNSFVPAGAPVVIGLDDTIERRWGPKISARGIYRDPVRSSKGHFVKASGLRWLSAMLLVQVPWAGRIMALPFLTLLAPSKRFYADKTRAPKTLLDWARQAVLQIHRWLPGRYIVLVADSAFAAIEFLAAVRPHVCVVTRLRLDANLLCSRTAQTPGPRTATC